MKRDTLRNGILMLIDCIPTLNINLETAAETWFLLLKDLADEEFQEAILEICKEGNIPYGTSIPAFIREKAGAGAQDDALDAWELASKALKGDVAVKDLPEPIKRALVSVCPDIRMVQSSELKWIRNDFLKTYPSMKRRENLKLLREHPEIKFLED